MDTVINNNPVQTEIYLDRFFCPLLHTLQCQMKVRSTHPNSGSFVSSLHLLQVTTEKRTQLYKNQKSITQSHQISYLEEEVYIIKDTIPAETNLTKNTNPNKIHST